MEDNVVALKPKAFDGLYAIAANKTAAVLHSLVERGRLSCDNSMMARLGDEKLIRAYWEAAENANAILDTYFKAPKTYTLDLAILKRDRTEEYQFTFFLSGINKEVTQPMATFHVIVSFQPDEDILTRGYLTAKQEYPIVTSVDRGLAHALRTKDSSYIPTPTVLNEVISGMNRRVVDTRRQRYGCVVNLTDGTPVILLGYEYFDSVFADHAKSTIFGFEIEENGEMVRKAAHVCVKLELNLNYIDVNVDVTPPQKQESEA